MTSGFEKNPYEGIDWKKVNFLPGCTHIHCRTQEHFARLVQEGMRVFTLSNYYPSAPYYPLREIRENTFRMGQKGYFKEGRYCPDYVDFTKYSGVTDPGKPLFSGIPDDLIEAPNAEHHWFSDVSIYLHITAPGALLTSGHFDIRDEFGARSAGYQLGLPLPWKKGFDLLLDSLIYPDGGGIVIAHPQWSHFSTEFICQMLDYDDRVLGIEVVNYGSEQSYTGCCESLWDEILRTGRRCFGFFVQDHLKEEPWKGKIILLVDDPSPRAALKAMREGRFYGAVTGEVKFEYVRFDGRRFEAACDHEVFFQVISRRGVEAEHTGMSISFDVPESQRAQIGYLRLDARYGRRNDKLYTQPVWL